MNSLPLILVREFGGLNYTYRIPLRRARNFWEFLEHIHETFSKPWELYNSHLHLDNGPCDGRVSPSEWDAGGYFEAEFLVEGRLMLYAHFEEVELRKPEPECKKRSRSEAWRWGWHGSEGPQDKWYDSQVMNDDEFDHWEVDPYPPFPETLPLDTPTDVPIYAPSTNNNKLPHTYSQATLSPTPTTEIITIHDSNTSCYLHNGIIIGRAKPECCRDPKVRPVARAILNSRGSVCVYICGKYAKRRFDTEIVQIGIKDVEFSEEFKQAPSEGKRLTAIRHRLQEKLDIQQQPNTTNVSKTPDLPPSTPITNNSNPNPPTTTEHEGIIIGQATPTSCRNPNHPPIVRATLNSVGAVIAFIPGEDSLRPFTKGKAQLQLTNVTFTPEFAAVSPGTRIKFIKGKIQQSVGTLRSGECTSVGRDGERLVDVEGL